MNRDSVEERPFSTGQLIKGLLVGLLIGIACLALDFFLGLILSSSHYMFLGSLVIAAVLIGIGFIAVKRSRDNGFLRGMLITLALAFIVCTICGIGLGPGPLRFGP